MPEQLEITEQVDTFRLWFDLGAGVVGVIGPVVHTRKDEIEPLACPVGSGMDIDRFFEGAMGGHCISLDDKSVGLHCLDFHFVAFLFMNATGEFRWKRLLHTLPNGDPAEWIVEIHHVVKRGGKRRFRTHFRIPPLGEDGRYVR